MCNHFVVLFRKLISLTLSFALLSFASFFDCTAFAENLDPDFLVETNVPPHVVFMGDSIAAGFGLDGYSADDKSQCASYANILAAVFDSNLPDEADFAFENVAADGLTSKKLLKGLQNGDYDDALKSADAVLLSIGGNDLLGPFFSIFNSENSLSDTVDKVVSLDSTLDDKLSGFEENLPEIVREIKARSDRSDFKLFVQTLYNPFQDHAITPLANLSEEKIGKLNEIIKSCSDGGEEYITADVAEAFSGRAEELTNIKDYDIHPNAEGHAEIAKILQPVVESCTYTYYDNEAAVSQQIQAEQKRQINKSKSEIAAAVLAGVGLAIAVSMVISLYLTNRKRKKIAKGN